MVLFYIEDRHLKSKMQLGSGGGGLLSDVCAAQMWEDPQNPCESPGVMMHSVGYAVLLLGRWTQEDPWGSLSRQPICIEGVSERLYLKKVIPEEDA